VKKCAGKSVEAASKAAVCLAKHSVLNRIVGLPCDEFAYALLALYARVFVLPASIWMMGVLSHFPGEPAGLALTRRTSGGSVEAGKIANMVLFDANPLEDFRNSKKIRGVILSGNFMDRTRLDELLARQRLSRPQK
jgi:hypothetical protein